MKTKIYNFITKANQIIFFGFAIFMAIIFLLSLIPILNTPQVTIINTKESNSSGTKVQEIIYEKVFSKYIKDTYVIELKSNQILQKSRNNFGLTPTLGYSSMIGYSGDKLALVNLLFTKRGESARKLFDKDSYITSFKLYKIRSSKRYNSMKLEKNIYSVIKDDTNKDNILDSKDREDLYVSDYDGQNLTLVTEDIVSYKLVEDNQVLISKMLKNQTQLYIYDVLSKELTLLDTTVK